MNRSSNRKSLNRSDFFALDVLVVMRGDRVVRVMGNVPGTRVVILNLGNKKHPPGLRYFGALGTSWDPFEMEAYIAEYLKRTGNEEEIQQDVDIESLRRKAEELLRMEQGKVTNPRRESPPFQGWDERRASLLGLLDIAQKTNIYGIIMP